MTKGVKRTGAKRGMQKPLVTIENWEVVQSVTSPSYEELQPGKHLMGNVFGHTSLPKAKYIYTSPILRVDFNSGLVETRNTVYQLGEASDAYKTWEHERKNEAAA
jgi:hypothetical protein